MRSADEQVPFRIVQAVRPDGTHVVTVSGELDIATAPQLAAALGRHAAAGGHTVLDVSAVKFMDSKGLAVLLGAARRAAGQGRTFSVAPDLSPQVAGLFAITGVSDMLGLPG